MSAQIKTCTVQEVYDLLKVNQDAVMVDVREQTEVDQVAPAVGRFFPMSQINPDTFASDCGVRKDQALYLFCRSGNRSMRVAEALAQNGFTNLTNVSGGILAWQAEGLPLKVR